MTNVAAAVNVNVTDVNGEAKVQVGGLPTVLVAVVVTEKGLRDITMDANAKTAVRMTATTESVSNIDPISLFCFTPFAPRSPHLSPPVIFNPLEGRSHRTLKAPLALSTGRYLY